MSRPSAEVIARSLVAAHYIQQDHYEVWLRARNGETMAAIHFDYPFTHGGQRRGASTLYGWVVDVDRAILVQRMLSYLAEERSPSGCTVASGSRTRHVGNPTELGKRPDWQSSWDAERLRLFGLLDRWSRKR